MPQGVYRLCNTLRPAQCEIFSYGVSCIHRLLRYIVFYIFQRNSKLLKSAWCVERPPSLYSVTNDCWYLSWLDPIYLSFSRLSLIPDRVILLKNLIITNLVKNFLSFVEPGSTSEIANSPGARSIQWLYSHVSELILSLCYIIKF